MRLFRKGKSKFYREFMKSLITDIIAILFGILFFIGFVRALVSLK